MQKNSGKFLPSNLLKLTAIVLLVFVGHKTLQSWVEPACIFNMERGVSRCQTTMAAAYLPEGQKDGALNFNMLDPYFPNR